MTTFYERIGSRGNTILSFRLEGGMCRGVYLAANTGANMFKPGNYAVGGQVISGGDVIGEILGYADVGTRKLTRKLPLAHPLCPWLYAAAITGIQGVGRASSTQAAMTQYDAEKITDTTASFPYYEISVEFAPRPYALFEDEAIYDSDVSWYDTDGSTVTTRMQEEWQRFVDVEVRPNAEIITAQQGQSFFATSTASLDPTPALGHASNPHGFTFQGFPRITTPRAQVIVRWFNVPISYVMHQNSYLVRYIGRVNQTAFMGWPAGSLLYEGFNHRRYTPAAPALAYSDGALTLDVSKLCDIEMQWSLVYRTQASVPDFSAINRNWITSGHNLLPWFGNRKFYHAVYPTPGATNTTSGWRPTYDSVPFGILFQNPAWA